VKLHKKIYIHHFFSEILFYKIAHNTTNKKFEINDNKVGKVHAQYGGVNLEFIFNPLIGDEKDGYHVIDFYTSKYTKNINPIFSSLRYTDDEFDLPFFEKLINFLNNKNNWIVLYLRTEKIIGKEDFPNDHFFEQINKYFKKLSNHYIISDNFFINDYLIDEYPNVNFVFTNTIWQWNQQINVRYYYEFKKIFDKLNFDYELMYSVRNYQKHRVEILKRLSNYNNPKILLQRTDTQINQNYKKYKNELDTLPNIYNNKLEGTTDFSNLKIIEHKFGINYDLFFSFLGKSKMQVLDESWAWQKRDFDTQYISEKTIGLLLSGIPFISTHSYPLILLEKILDCERHPFFDESHLAKGDSKLFVAFVKKFMENFDNNYKLCKEWTDNAHIKFINKIETENSLLDFLVSEIKNKKIEKQIV